MLWTSPKCRPHHQQSTAEGGTGKSFTPHRRIVYPSQENWKGTTGKSLAHHRKNRHGAFCFGHAAHAFRTWGGLPPLMEVRIKVHRLICALSFTRIRLIMKKSKRLKRKRSRNSVKKWNRTKRTWFFAQNPRVSPLCDLCGLVFSSVIIYILLLYSMYNLSYNAFSWKWNRTWDRTKPHKTHNFHREKGGGLWASHFAICRCW